MKYFMPYWEDWVHADFDPVNDTYGKGGYDNSLFAHEIFSFPPYDGILISLGMFKLKLRIIKENGRPKIRNFYNIKEYLRVPQNFTVFGDCGAFTYVNEKQPLISLEKAAECYHFLGFDYGVSVDHICSDVIVVKPGEEKRFSFTDAKEVKGKRLKLFLSQEELEFRRALSLKNAKKFIEISRFCEFTPVGAAQGYSVETYMDSIKKLISYGYRYIAVGGLVPRKTSFISALLDAIRKEIDLSNIRLHLLGILREELLPKMADCGIYSFDSASYFRKAWLRADQNYLGADEKWYASIRVPRCCDPRLKRKVRGSGIKLEALEGVERKILKGLRDYDRGKLKEIDSLLEEIMNYDRLFFRDDFKEEKYVKLYKRLLESKIWKECDCEICRSLGIDVVIFRGSNRNKRRGFHNTFRFYRKFKMFLKKRSAKVVYGH